VLRPSDDGTEVGRGVFRAVPVPVDLLDTLDIVHVIREAQQKGKPHIYEKL
jgi:hypothetical protein